VHKVDEKNERSTASRSSWFKITLNFLIFFLPWQGLSRSEKQLILIIRNLLWFVNNDHGSVVYLIRLYQSVMNQFLSKGKKISREAAKDAKEIFSSRYLTEKYLVPFATFADSLCGRFSFIGHGGSKVLVPACPG
jgi:hypothetical protein